MTRAPLRLLLTLLLLPCATVLASEQRVVVRPLEVYNARDVEALASGLQSMLASRLAGPGYSVETVKTQEPGEEAWAVRMTITHLGGVYSIDASLEPVTGTGEGTRTYETARSVEALLPALDQVAARLREALVRIAASSEAPPASAGAVPAPAPPRAPAPSPIPSLPAAEAPTGASPLQEEAHLALALRNHRAGPTVPGEALSLVVADVDRDGSHEILLLLDDVIVAFRDVDGALVRAWESPVPRGFQPRVLSAGDVDGNGLPELFVAGMSGTQPVTQALEWFGSALAPKGSRLHAFLRVVHHPERGPILLGRTPGLGKDLFGPTVGHFVWTGSTYREEGTFVAPPAAGPVNLDLVSAGDPGGVFSVITSRRDTLWIYDAEGNRVFQGADSVKGSRIFLRGEERVGGRQDEDIFRVQGRTLSWVGNDGRPVLLTARNQSSVGRILQRIASFSHGQLLALRWDGLTLTTVAEGPKIPGFIPDLDLGPQRPEGRTAYVALVQTEGGLFRTMNTRLIAYDLPIPAATR
ncbi:MAG: VCBS repeat-containing protein [Deferrisomatales bacterium]|nr:VCBS repeat-containing protein [Deferrisomatales bacterium]